MTRPGLSGPRPIPGPRTFLLLEAEAVLFFGLAGGVTRGCRRSGLAAMSTFAEASAYPIITSVPAGRP